MANPYNLESEMEAGGPEEDIENPITDTDVDEDDRMDHDFPGHRHAYRDDGDDKSPYCSCGKNLDA